MLCQWPVRLLARPRHWGSGTCGGLVFVMFLLGLFGMAIDFALGPVCSGFCAVFVALKL